MFYSQYILARKGPLGKIWLAAHFEKKLTKSQVFGTDISESVNTIVNPTVPLALRVSGHLMLGIVRIYSDKVRYLSSDCRDAMTRIKLAFKTQTNRVDIDEGAVGKIDDANYALLPFDEDDQSTQIAFHRKALRSIPRLDESDVTSFFAVGDIELLRHDISRQSIQSRRSTEHLEPRRSIGQSGRKLEDDDLPAFDGRIGENLFTDVQFESYEPFEIPLDLPENSTSVISPANRDEEEKFDFEPPQILKKKIGKQKRRRVEINDRVEISDRQWKQRLVDVDSIIRKPVETGDQLLNRRIEDRLDDITGSLRYCPELGDLIGMFNSSGRNDIVVSQPEILRRDVDEDESFTAEGALREPQYPNRQSLNISKDLAPTRESINPELSHDYFSQYDYSMGADQIDVESNAVVSAIGKSLDQEGNIHRHELSAEQRSERTKAVFTIVSQELATKKSESLQEFCAGCTKPVAARFFLELLQLKTWGQVELSQKTAFGPIIVQLSSPV